jgi:hypothetical protein
MTSLHTALRLWLTLTMLAIGSQFFFAAAGAFGAMSYDTHKTVGGLLVLAGLVALALGTAIRRYIVPLAIGFVLLIVQYFLGRNGFQHPWLGALHGLNALAIAAVLGSTTGRAWGAARAARAAGPEPAPVGTPL